MLCLLNAVAVRDSVRQWLLEDGPGLDFGGHVVGNAQETGHVRAKSRGVLAGRPFFDAIFAEVGCTVQWAAEEGSWVGPVDVQQLPQLVATVTGAACDLLRGERVALNVLSRASGVATAARTAVDTVRAIGWQGRIAGTRKTTPGFRLVEKYALAVGGADTHRYDLHSMVMLKDNHIWSVGGIAKAIAKCNEVSGFSLKVEVECGSLEEAIEAAQAGCDVIMLDNFAPEDAVSTSARLKRDFPHVLIEVSGGVNYGNISAYATTAVDVVSLGCLTQGYSCVDFSLSVPKTTPLHPRK